MFGSLRKGLAVSRTGLECTEAQDDLELALLLLRRTSMDLYGPVWTSMGLACLKGVYLGNAENTFSSSNEGSFSGIGQLLGSSPSICPESVVESSTM